MTEAVDVIVVGAGLAGLTTAHALTDEGLGVRVLEARDRVGGRTLDHSLGQGRVVEAGGQFVGPTQNRVLDLAATLGIDTFPAYDTGLNAYIHGDRRRLFGNGIPPDLLVLPDLARMMTRINKVAGDIPVGAPWEAPHARDLDGQTLSTWVRKHSFSSGALELLNVLLGSAFGKSADEVSALFGLWYVAGCGDELNQGTIERMMGVRGGAQESRIVGGSQLLSLRLAERLGEAVAVNVPVQRIEQTELSVTVYSGESSWTAPHVVVTVPPNLITRIDWAPALPPHQAALFERMPFGALMKCEAVYDRPFWREEGLSGQGIFRDPSLGVCSMFDNSPADGSRGVLMGFVGADQWRQWANRSDQERRGSVLRAFARVVGPRALRPIDWIEKDWTSDPWTQGGPTSSLGPGVLTGLGQWRDKPFGLVHWAGAEHADYWNGYLDGAVRSGEQTAATIVAIREAGRK
ncbi:flavin monoamine oxidase family protein [Gordonia sp. CPCC 205333]|uniref:flavin monoamine oxidase family protein n=1 Tax=Gordonia sp. CPCC 205333 TaxID=3140790 RepID=UPI003AF39F8C